MVNVHGCTLRHVSSLAVNRNEQDEMHSSNHARPNAEVEKLSCFEVTSRLIALLFGASMLLVTCHTRSTASTDRSST